MKDILKFINSLEENFPVGEWKINDICIWPLIRLRIFFYLFKNLYTDKLEKKERNNLQKKFRTFTKLVHDNMIYSQSYIKDRKKNDSTNIRSKVVFLSNGVSFEYIDNKWYEKYCDPLKDHLSKEKITSLMLTPQNYYYTPRYSKSIFIQPFLDFINIKSQFFQKPLTGISNNLRKFNELLIYCNDYYPNYDIKGMLNIDNLLNKFFAYVEYFKKLLNIIKPKISFIVCYYDLVQIAFTCACNDLGILSCDIQHGYINKSHPAYSKWKNIPENGYELLPHYFWCWSNAEVTTIEKWNKNVKDNHRAFVGENLYIDMWKSESSITQSYDRLIADIKKHKKKKYHILFTFNNVHFDEIKSAAKILRNFIKDEKLQSTLFWLRMHPCRMEKDKIVKEYLKNKNLDNFIIDPATRFPLYALLRNTDMHITEYSSTIIEATRFGVNSIIINTVGVDIFKDYLSSKHVFSCNNIYEITEIAKKIFTLKNDKGQETKQKVIEKEINVNPILANVFNE